MYWLNLVILLDSGLTQSGLVCSKISSSCGNFANPTWEGSRNQLYDQLTTLYMLSKLYYYAAKAQIKMSFKVGDLKTVPQGGGHEASNVQGIKQIK